MRNVPKPTLPGGLAGVRSTPRSGSDHRRLGRVDSPAGRRARPLCSRSRRAGLGRGGVVIAQGDVRWADLPDPAGSGPGFRRPVVVVQGDALNRSRIATAVCVPLTSNLRWAEAPGNFLLPARSTGLPRDSVALTPSIVSIDRRLLDEQTGQVSDRQLSAILGGIDIVLGR